MTDKMIRLLSERQNPANDFKLQHAILGALRNFAVTAQVRQILLDKGMLPQAVFVSEIAFVGKSVELVLSIILVIPVLKLI